MTALHTYASTPVEEAARYGLAQLPELPRIPRAKRERRVKVADAQDTRAAVRVVAEVLEDNNA